MSGPPLGRRPAHVSKATKKQAREDEKARQAIEGKFGQAKRRFNLDRVMAKLDNTSQTVVAIAFLVINLVAGLRRLLWLFFRQFLLTTTGLAAEMIKDYVPISQPKEKLNSIVCEQ